MRLQPQLARALRAVQVWSMMTVPAPRYFIQRGDEPWTEVLAAGFAAAEREVGFPGPGTPTTTGFVGASSRTGCRIRGRLVRDIYAVVGSRRWDDRSGLVRAQEIIEARLTYSQDGPRPDAVVSGGADGIDSLAERIAEALDLVVISHRPQVRRFHGPGGYRERDEEIAQDATRGLCIRSSSSTTYGSGWTADRMEALGKPVERIML